MDYMDADVLKEICLSNGIQFNDAKTDIYEDSTLFILFSGFSHWISFQCFPFLTELIVISQDLTYIANLETCPNLKKLWICECKLTRIENLNHCHKLKELYLYENRIEKIENLCFNISLRVLWLNDNLIKYIEGLDCLTRLTELNLSGNLIEYIGDGLKNNLQLTSLFISGNHIWNPHEISTLAGLPCLNSLAINEPEYLKNPICSNPNLILLLLYRLPKLKNLDHVSVHSLELRQAVRNVIQLKQSFYALKSENNRTLNEHQITVFKQSLNGIREKIHAQVCQLDKCYKHILYGHLRKCKSGVPSELETQNELSRLVKEIKCRTDFWNSLQENISGQVDILIQRLRHQSELRQKLYQLELEMCGYLEVKQGTPQDEWFCYCSDLIASRFCHHNPALSCITGVRVLHIYRITNRIFHEWYDKATNWCDNCGTSLFTKAEECICEVNNQDFLFMPRPDKSDELTVYIDILRSGFKISSEPCILTNNLNRADSNNLKNFKHDKLLTDMCFPYRRAIFLISRAILKADSKQYSQPVSCNFESPEVPYKGSLKYSFSSNESTSCSCDEDKKDYLFTDSKLILPEFLVELEYIVRDQSTSIISQLMQNPNFDLKTPVIEKEIETDQVILKKLYGKLYKSNNLENIDISLKEIGDLNQYCNTDHKFLLLNDVRCPRSLNLQKYSNLTFLSITHCQIQKIPVFHANHLCKLDISYNKISSLNSLQKLSKLILLDASYNLLIDVCTEISIIQSCAPNLEGLSLIGNPWKWEHVLRPYAITKLGKLKSLNNQLVTDEEASLAKQLIELSSINPRTIEGASSSDLITSIDNLHLTIYPVAYYLLHQSPVKYITFHSASWESISSICLENLNLRKIEALEQLINVKFISLNYNCISLIEGLHTCTNLIELCLEYNYIENLDNIGHLKNLQKLLVGNNCIKTINENNLKNLSSLRTLGLRNNSISKINGIESCKSLMELYLGNNKLKDIKNVLVLKSLPYLTIVELSGNPLGISIPNYRLRVIYYLKSLKAMDGLEVGLSEQIQSKEIFGGRLCHEFLMERLQHDEFFTLVHLDLPNCMLKAIDFLDPTRLTNLKSINLEKNHLTSFGGLVFLENLKVICLNDNFVESLFPRNICSLAANKNFQNSDSIESKFVALYRANQLIFSCLQVLHLAQNGIKTLQEFQFHRMSNLRALFLQDNELNDLNGLEGLSQLKEIVLDNNKIKVINEVSFLYNWSLQEIHIENNRLKELYPLGNLEHLKRLYVGGNKLNSLIDLENFARCQPNLIEISLIDNPITTKQAHRVILVNGLPKLHSIDGVPITDEERERAQLFYAEKEFHEALMSANLSPGSNHLLNAKGSSICPDFGLPGINSQKSLLSTVKIFDGLNFGQNCSTTSKNNQDVHVYNKNVVHCSTNTDLISNNSKTLLLSIHNISSNFDQHKNNGKKNFNKPYSYHVTQTNNNLENFNYEIPGLSVQTTSNMHSLTSNKSSKVLKIKLDQANQSPKSSAINRFQK